MKLARLFGGRRRLTDFFDRFAIEQLPAILTGIGRSAAVKIEPFSTGGNAFVRRLILADGHSLVLRAYFVDPAKQEGFSHWHLTRHLAQRGFRVPTVLFRDVSSFPRGKADVEVLIEEFVEGELMANVVQDNPAVRRQLAETLHRLHTDHSPQPGHVWLGDKATDPLHLMAAKAPVLLDRIRSQLPDVPSQQTEQCLAWLREAIARRPIPQSYELIHGGLDRNDAVLTPTGEIALIDLGSMAYGYFETDLVNARWGFFDQPWWEGFCADYFAADSASRERFEATAPLFFAFFYLVKSSRNASSAGKAIKKRDAEAAESHLAKSRRFWNLLLAAVGG